MKNNNKLAFARTLNGYDGSRGGTACYHYGSMSGCDDQCPALWDGECEVIDGVLKNVEFSTEDKKELIEMYNVDSK